MTSPGRDRNCFRFIDANHPGVIYIGNESQFRYCASQGGQPSKVSNRFTGEGLLDDLPGPWRLWHCPAFMDMAARQKSLRIVAGPADCGDKLWHWRRGFVPSGKFVIAEDIVTKHYVRPCTVDGRIYRTREEAEAELVRLHKEMGT